MSGLSRLQRDVLTWAWRETVALEASGDSTVRIWGVRWHPEPQTPAGRAVLSRALRRLEERRLVVRKNQATNGMDTTTGRRLRWRTTHVLLTEAGRDLAQRLITPEPHALTVADAAHATRSEPGRKEEDDQSNSNR
jgi:hypothetical protein